MKKKVLASFLVLGLLIVPTIYPKAETLKDYKNLLNKYS